MGTRSVTLTRQGTLQECADRIKDFGLCLQQQRADIPPEEQIDIKCERLNNTQIKMILCYKDGCPIEKGTFNIWAQIKGDLNDDGLVNAFDINPFIGGLTDPLKFRNDFRLDPGIVGDCNNDGVLNAFDIQCFIERLLGGGQPVAALRQLRALIPGEDLDGDGIINADEAIAGTDPANGSDFLRILSLSRDDDGIRITWSSVEGKLYQLEYSEDLRPTSWDAVNAGAIVAEGLESAFVDPAPDRAASNLGYYRLRVISNADE